MDKKYRVDKINSYNGWDPLKQVILGNIYKPEFFEDLPDPRTRDLMQQLLYETHEDLDNIQKTMEDLGVDVVRTPSNATQISGIENLVDFGGQVPEHGTVMEWWEHEKECGRKINGIPKPCLSPRDMFITMGDKLLYTSGYIGSPTDIKGVLPLSVDLISPDVMDMRLAKPDDGTNMQKWFSTRGPFKLSDEYMKEYGFALEWNDPSNPKPPGISRNHKYWQYLKSTHAFWAPTVTRCGDRLIVDNKDVKNLSNVMEEMYPQFKTPNVAIGGHNDGSFNLPKPGLAICAPWVEPERFKDTLPGWDILRIQDPTTMQSDWGPWEHQKHLAQGRYWTPDMADNPEFANYVDNWLSEWVGLSEETVFEVNMLSVNESTILSLNYQKEVHNKLQKHGIEPVYCRFRHRNFWDAGLHCLTVDTVREGGMQNYFE
jgi:hypothetical protein|tara:strand:+ start:1143 stop:2429 length:1287 start_codon:yes stop_codon:yes gene_type:complete